MEQQLNALITYLLGEQEQYQSIEIPDGFEEKWKLYRALVNVREPKPISEEYLKAEDAFLTAFNAKRGVTSLTELTCCEPGIYLWQGDITTLAADGIVNAANSALLGCFSPGHSCIDNAIHSFSGVRLRLKCAEIMNLQGTPEPTGKAKITPAYNLPSRFVLHTVGPIVHGMLNDRHKALLSACYRSCLELADKNGLKSLAFCCISTGVFGFPAKPAAKIAVETVRQYKAETLSEIEVIFNVFSDTDKRIYEEILG